MTIGILRPKNLASYTAKLIVFLLCFRTLPLLGIAPQQVTASPDSIAYGNQAQATTSAATTVTLFNDQSAVLTISNIRISGNYAIANNGCGATLAAFASCDVSVTFTPTGLGNRTGNLTFVDNFRSSPQIVTLSGTGVVPVGVAPTSLAFGSQAVGLPSAAKTVTLTNNLDTALSLTSAAVTGDYAIASNTCGTSVPARSACTVGVTLSPTATGSRPGTLKFTDSASNSPQTVNLTGSGVVPVTVTPASLAFGKQAVGSASPGKTITLTNNENIALNLSVAVGGNYGITANTCGTSVPANTACALTVAFTPTATGSQTGTLTLTDSSSNSPQKVNLSGTGVVPVAVSPATLAFGNQLVTTPSAAKTVTLTNNNAVPLNITGVATPGDYLIQSTSCGATVAAASSCTLTVAFQPTALGSRPGTLVFTDDANNSPQTVKLTGTGVTTGITSIVVSPTNSSVPKGTPQQFAVSGNRSSGSPLTLTNAVTWSSSAATVATINSTGLASTLATGTTTIKAVLGTFNNSTTLTVGAKVLSGVTVTPANPFLPLGRTQQFTATGNYTDGTTTNLTGTANVLDLCRHAGLREGQHVQIRSLDVQVH